MSQIVGFFKDLVQWIGSFRHWRRKRDRRRMWLYMLERQRRAQAKYHENVCLSFSEFTLCADLGFATGYTVELLYDLMCSGLVEPSPNDLHGYSVCSKLRPRPYSSDCRLGIVAFPLSVPFVTLPAVG